MGDLDLVTGAAGFIGRHLARALHAAGRSVRGLDVSARPTDLRVDEYVQGSVLDADACARAADGVARVFHVAGDASLWRRRRDGYRTLNVGGTVMMLDATRAAGVRRFVHTSTDVVAFPTLYGAYARSKHEAEGKVRGAIERGLNGVIVRAGAPIGPNDTNLTPPTQMLRFFLSTPPPAFYNGDVAWIDVRDLAAAFVAAADSADAGATVTAAGDPEPMATMVASIGRIASRPMPTATIPYPVALAAALAAEATIGRFTGRAPIATSAGVRMAKRGRRREATQNATGLGVRYRPLDASVRDAARWLVDARHVSRGHVAASIAQPAEAGAA